MTDERGNLCAELSEIEVDLVEQPVRTYRRGANHAEFWEVVRRVGSFSEMRKKSCGEKGVEEHGSR